METTLHRQLKQRYDQTGRQQEVAVGPFRVDAVRSGWLVEIQTGSLAAIRNKVGRLLEAHRVLVVKPLPVRKFLVKWNRAATRVISSRYSPFRGHPTDAFVELVHLVELFPHPRLAVELLVVELEEHRVPSRRARCGYRVKDRVLRDVRTCIRLRQPQDLVALLPEGLQRQAATQAVTTADMARHLDVPRWVAQKVAYCLRKSGAARVVGKRGNALLYRLSDFSERPPLSDDETTADPWSPHWAA